VSIGAFQDFSSSMFHFSVVHPQHKSLHYESSFELLVTSVPFLPRHCKLQMQATLQLDLLFLLSHFLCMILKLCIFHFPQIHCPPPELISTSKSSTVGFFNCLVNPCSGLWLQYQTIHISRHHYCLQIGPFIFTFIPSSLPFPICPVVFPQDVSIAALAWCHVQNRSDFVRVHYSHGPTILDQFQLRFHTRQNSKLEDSNIILFPNPRLTS